MQQAGQAVAKGKAAAEAGRAVLGMGPMRGRGGEGRKRVETIVGMLARLPNAGETLSEVAHDARNMVAALGLYCDLLEEPGVLAAPFAHYGRELRLVAAATQRLVGKIVALDTQNARKAGPPAPELFDGERRTAAGMEPGAVVALTQGPRTDPGEDASRNRRWELLPAVPVANLAAELLANRNLLSALAGPSIGLTMDTGGGALPVRLTGEDLTRVLVNLVKNAAEAMPGGGRVSMCLSERPATQGAAACLELAVEDNGPGIPVQALETVFTSGYTTHSENTGENGSWSFGHRGLGLAITRAIVEGAGGRITARNREQGGARFEIELPVRKTGC
ncbi:MAG: ATP-binding protein [Terracidiphilus sp.]|jgi:signal transduction histidine kinase